jgi:internalin A
MNNYSIHIMNYLKTQSWQIAALVIIVAAITFVLKNKSAHVRYLLWLIVLAKCLVPPFLTVPLAVLPEPKVTTVLPSAEPIVAAPVLSPVTEMPATPKPVIAKHTHKLTLHEWLAIGWIMGIAIFITVAVTKALRTELWLRRERKPLPTGLQSEVKELFTDLGIRILPKLWLAEEVGQPFVWGLLRGGIYLPVNFIKANNTEYRKGVLAHELSHVLRFDAAVNLLQVAAQAIFWFHPFVWWANKKIRAEREKCCDEMAIARLGTQVKDYSNAIVNILIGEHESTRPIPSLAVAGPVKNIEERIKTMLRPGKKFYKHPSIASALVVLFMAFLTIPTTLVLTARGQTQSSAQDADRLTTNNGQPEQPRFAARTFNSTVALEVWVREASSPMTERRIGRTPSADPIEIPPCQMWLVLIWGPVKDWDLLVREIKRNKIPGLTLTAPTDSDLAHLADLDGLQQLNLTGRQVTDTGLQHLKDLTTLQGLMLANAQVTDAGLEHLTGLTGLQRLWFIGCPITDSGLAQLKHLTGLQDLGLFNTQITDTGLVHLKDLTELRFLYLDGTQLTDASLAHLGGLTALQSLGLTRTRVTDAGLAFLDGLTGLQELLLGGDTQVTDAGLQPLEGMARMKRLVLADTKVTDAGLEHLKGMTQLQELRLGGTLITDTGLEYLKSMPYMEDLTLRDTRITGTGLAYLKDMKVLKSLNLTNTKTADASLEYLKGLTKLEYLYLERTPITDKGLAHLYGLTRLRSLDLSSTHVTDAGVQQLQQALPNLEIER